MNSNKFILFLLVLFILVGCKKQSTPEPEYLLERDNPDHNPTIRNTLSPSPQTSYEPTAADTITAVFVCEKARYKSGNAQRVFVNAFYYYDASQWLSFDSLIKMPSHKLEPNMIQFSPNDSSNVTITYAKGNDIIHSTKGHPSCILDQFPISCSVCSPYDAAIYKIKYNGNPNTDKIFSRGNGYLNSAPGELKIKAYSSSSNKSSWYSIYFENYSSFKVNGKWFVLINRISDACEAHN